MLTLLTLLAFSILLVLCLTLLSNLFVFPRLRPASPAPEPFVSILIPARNEAHIIAQTITALRAQTYQRFELLILDDHSTDETAHLADVAAHGDPRIRIISGADLPPGWMGKAWACQQLGQRARGEYLIFTDADTRWHPHALQALVAHQQATHADLLTIWPTQITQSFAERVVVPLMMMVVMSYLPILMTHHSPFALFAAANGQCMSWRRSAYWRVGCHHPVAQNVLDDVTLARAAKRHGLHLRMADGNRLIACRMYTNWPTVRDGFSKNILAGYGSSVSLLLAATLFHWLIFLLPYPLLLTDLAPWAGLLLLMGFTLRLISALYTRQRPQDALSLPLGVLLMTRIALQALYWHFTGGARWKGRVIAPSAKG